MANQASSAVNQVKEVNPLDVKAAKKTDDSTLVKNIVTTETSGKPKSILGEAPKVDISLLQDMTPPISLFLVILKIFFGLLFIFSVISVLFFTSQLTMAFDLISSKFGIPNVSQELSSNNSEIVTLQTDLNTYQYLEIKGYLDRFSYDGDLFIKNYEITVSQTASDSEKDKALNMIDTARSSLRESFLKLRGIFANNFYIQIIDKDYVDSATLQTLFEEKLRIKLNEKADDFANNENEQAKRDYKNYIHAINLVGNANLKNLFINTDFDTLSDGDLYSLIKNINSLIVNDLSIIQSLKDKRIKWSDIINEIELRTMEIDSFYSKDLYKDVGGIRYTSYDFDSANRSISIVGETMTFDTTTFTTIADLIDKLNKSDLFENGEMRSFSKSGSLEDGYKASLKLNLHLQEDGVLK